MCTFLPNNHHHDSINGYKSNNFHLADAWRMLTAWQYKKAQLLQKHF